MANPRSAIDNRHRNAGSVMILVVVMLVLLALAGTAYMQRVRLDRQATRIPPTRHIDEITAAVLAQLKGVLKDDLVSAASGNFLDAADGIEGYDYPWTSAAVRRPATLYNGTVLLGAARPLGGQLDDVWLASSYPDQVQYDPPTAATEFGWRHLTNLNGIFLSLPEASYNHVAQRPFEHVTNLAAPGAGFAAFDNTDTALLLCDLTPSADPATDADEALDTGFQNPTLNNARYLPRGYDVDGDGVPDSRWTWAPIRNLDGIDYVMAVRIIDHGAMVNVNAASPLTFDGAALYLTGAAAPSALWPSTLDLSRLMGRRSLAASEWRDPALVNLLRRRSAGATGGTYAPTPHWVDPAFGPTPQRIRTVATTAADYYWNRLLFYGYTAIDAAQFGPDSEIALRFGNGVRSTRFGVTPLEMADGDDTVGPVEGRGLGDLLRQRQISGPSDVTDEFSFEQVIDTSYASDPIEDRVRAFFLGAPAGPAAPGYLIDDLRKWLTTYNGAAEILPRNFFATPTQPREDRHAFLPFEPMPANDPANPNRLGNVHRNITQAEVDYMADRLAQIFLLGPGAGEGYLGRNPAVPADQQQLTRLAGNFAAAIKDYCDEDYQPTEWEDPANLGDFYYGMERLPLFRQVYLQAAFTLQNNVVPDPFADPPPTGDYPDTLVFDPDSQIFVVEMGNPFSDEIDFSRFQDSAGNWGLRLLIRQPASGQSWWYTFTNAGGPGMINASATLAGGEVMLVYNDPLSKTQLEDDPQNLANFVDADYETPVLGPADSPTGFQRPSYNLGQRLIFELQIDVDPDPFVTKWVTYDRLEGLTGDLQISDWDGHYVGEQPTASVGDKWYAQVTVARHTSDASNAPGPFYLSTQGQDFIPGFEPGTPPDATWVANARIGAINKTLSTARQAELANVQLMVANRPVLNPAELATICMFGFTDAATGGSFTERVPAMIGLANGANKAHTTVGGGHTFGIPRAMFLDFAPDAAVPAVPGANIPHAAMVLDLFSTISPQADGIDNDNDDHDGDPTTHADGDGITDGPPELFVPGRINVNTAPLHVLTLAAPLPEASLVDISNLMTMVLNYRDNQFFGGSMFREVTRSTGDLASGLRMTNYRLEPGVLSLAELMWMNPSDNGGFNIDMQFYLDPTNNNATDIGTAGMDVNPLYSELTANGGTRLNGAIDEDAEERIGRFQFLNQVFTTRSDVYTAYVEIRGYPADDYRAGPVERTRFLVVLDRGRITDPADEVRVVAMYRY